MRFGTLIIDGILKMDPTIDISIEANNIWIRSGELVAGDESTPFPKKLTITLYGTKDDNYVFINDLAGARTKSISVTGKLKLYSDIPATTWTFLTQNANTGDLEIHVSEANDWMAGDELALGPSGF